VGSLSDKVQEIIDAFNLLSPENQGTLFECACNILRAENSAKKSVDYVPGGEEGTFEESGTGLAK
jgi:hypothetical protein